VRSAAERIARATDLVGDDEVVIISLMTSARGGGYVVAGVVVTDVDSGEYFEPSRLWPGLDGNPR
jgi:hypothetical protein